MHPSKSPLRCNNKNLQLGSQCQICTRRSQLSRMSRNLFLIQLGKGNKRNLEGKFKCNKCKCSQACNLEWLLVNPELIQVKFFTFRLLKILRLHFKTVTCKKLFLTLYQERSAKFKNVANKPTSNAETSPITLSVFYASLVL